MLSDRKLIRTPLNKQRIEKSRHSIENSTSINKIIDEIDKKDSTQKELGIGQLGISDLDLTAYSNIDSNFDNTIENFEKNNYKDRITFNVEKNYDQKENQQKKEGVLSSNNFIKNGVSLIREQENRIRDLDSENYMLKLRIVTMQKLLSDKPEEYWKLCDANIKLNEEVVKLQKEIEYLNEKIKKNKIENDTFSEDYQKYGKENNLHIQNLKEKNFQLENLLKEKEESIVNFKKQSDRIKIEKKDLEILVNTLKTKSEDRFDQRTKILLSKLDESNDNKIFLEKKISSLNEEILTLKNDNSILQNNISILEKKNRNTDKYNDEIMHWRSKCEDIEEHYNKLISNNELKIEELKCEILNLRKDLSDSNYNFESVKKERFVFDEKIQNYTKSIQHLNDNLDSLKKENLNLKCLLDTEKKKSTDFETKLESKDERLLALKKQINFFLDEKKSKDENNSFFEHQVSSMKKKEIKLKDKISQLNSVINDLNEKNLNLDLSNSTQINEYKERLDFYENEYNSLQSEFSNLNIEVKNLNKKLLDKNNYISELIEKYDKLNYNFKNFSSNSDNSYLLNVSEKEKNQLKLKNDYLDDEKKNLNNEISSLKFEIDRLKSLYDYERKKIPLNDANIKSLKSQIDNLIADNNNLKTTNEKNFYESNILKDKYNDVLNDYNEMKFNLKNLEGNCLNLEKQLEEKNKLLNIQNSSKFSYSQNWSQTNDDNRIKDLLIEKSENELKIRRLEYDLQNLKKQNDLEISKYKSKILLIEESLEAKKLLEKKDNHNSDVNAIESLLELQLKEATKLTDDLSKLLSDTNITNDILQKKLRNLEEENSELINSQELYKTNESKLYQKNTKLESKITNLNQDILKITGHCRKLANKINHINNEKIKEKNSKNSSNKSNDELIKSKSKNIYLQKKIDLLSTKMAQLNLPDDNYKEKIKLLENQTKYFKAKLYDFNLKANDFQMMYQFVISSIQNSNNLIKNDINKLIMCGIYPDYSKINLKKLKTGKTLSFKIISIFVLSIVKIKLRYEKSEKRKIKLIELKSEIESSKLSILY